MHGRPAAVLTQHGRGGCSVAYLPGYTGEPVSLTLPVAAGRREYPGFPPFLDGLLLEGSMLEAFLQRHKLESGDCFSQLVILGRDMVGALTARELEPDEDPARAREPAP
jgi:serine/threonine-protein kinase HipA